MSAVPITELRHSFARRKCYIALGEKIVAPEWGPDNAFVL